MPEYQNSQNKAKEIRRQVLEIVYNSKHGHIGGSFSCVEILVALYYSILEPEDRFILSKGHASLPLYCILKDKGYDYDLDSFCKDGGLCGHPIKGNGIICDTGSLGHGLSIGAGIALAGKKVYVLCGDGELYEGQTWEALLFIAHHKLDVTLIIDRNRQIVQDFTEDINKLEPLYEKLGAFGWVVDEVDGHNINELMEELNLSEYNRPFCIIANTIKGKGVSFMEKQIRWHHSIPTKEEYELALKELDGI